MTTPAPDRSGPEDSARTPPLRPWDECECFCIRDYAGGRRAPCGWRGFWAEALPGIAGGPPRCPRCGGATLLGIPRPRGGGAPRG